MIDAGYVTVFQEASRRIEFAGTGCGTLAESVTFGGDHQRGSDPLDSVGGQRTSCTLSPDAQPTAVPLSPFICRPPKDITELLDCDRKPKPRRDRIVDVDDDDLRASREVAAERIILLGIADDESAAVRTTLPEELVYQPLTAPIVRPCTIQRWMNRARTTTGRVMSTAAAASPP